MAASPSEKDVKGGSELVELVMQLKREIDAERSHFDRQRQAFEQQVARLSGALKGAELERDTALAECERLRAQLAGGARTAGTASEAAGAPPLAFTVGDGVAVASPPGDRVLALEADLAAAKKLLAAMEADAVAGRGLAAQLDAAHADAARARERVALVETQRASLAARLSELENARREAEAALASVRADLEVARLELGRERERIAREGAELRTRVGELEGELATSSERSARLEAARASERKQAEARVSELERAQARERAELASRLHATEEAQARIIRESGEIMAQLSASRSSLEADLGRAVSRIATLEGELASERDRASSKVNELSRLHVRERDELRIALATSDEARARLVADVTQFAQQLIARVRGGTPSEAREPFTPQAMPRPVTSAPGGEEPRPKTGKIDLNDMLHRAKRLKPPGQS